MAAKRACRSLSRSLQHAVSRGAAMLPIKASCAMSEDRNSHGQGAGPAGQPNGADPTMSLEIPRPQFGTNIAKQSGLGDEHTVLPLLWCERSAGASKFCCRK
jgi:hypothetical protein